MSAPGVSAPENRAINLPCRDLRHDYTQPAFASLRAKASATRWTAPERRQHGHGVIAHPERLNIPTDDP